MEPRISGDMRKRAVPALDSPEPVAPVAANAERPFWSVMIPCANRTDYLRQTLLSVTRQAGSPSEMEICVVDNSTREQPWSELLANLPSPVRYFRQPRPLPMAENWNRSIAEARGRWVHLLHDDDWVQDGFYARLRAVAEAHHQVALLCTRVFCTDSGGAIKTLSERVPEWESPSLDLRPLFQRNPLRCPGVVVRREIYERVGGYRPGLRHCIDWDMWIRAIGEGGALMLNEALCYYREHESNSTREVVRQGDNLRETLLMGELLAARNHGIDRAELRHGVARAALSQSRFFSDQGDSTGWRANRRLWKELATPRERTIGTIEDLGRALRRLMAPRATASTKTPRK